MKVVLLSYTKDAERLCAAAARTCYSKKPASKLLEEVTGEGGQPDRGDHRPGASFGHRACLLHVQRRRGLPGADPSIGAPSDRVIQPAVPTVRACSRPSTSCPRAWMRTWRRGDVPTAMEPAWAAYRELAEKVPVEDARYVLPNACTTNITVTMNARELLHFFTLRCSSGRSGRSGRWPNRCSAWSEGGLPADIPGRRSALRSRSLPRRKAHLRETSK